MDSIIETMSVYVGAILGVIFLAVGAFFNFVIAEWKFSALIVVLLWGFVTLATTLQATERHLRDLRAQLDLLHEDLRKKPSSNQKAPLLITPETKKR